ncbi:adenylate/guanylate cyclase domain-containing protein [Microcella humidisoli]|jgi:class 3 adenylate cyclase|uniref:HAMP domain-containing protein n=1 Tax=Microcella humidisoli TaxID=2963406 RepID=A0ABY5FXZ3_9MICO|nr:adenylate/guanylate cyclase domain-containing protein [Microcella humidisoli]UTT63192.1 HAMP domain-containing protein [Microcella humidisoli]
MSHAEDERDRPSGHRAGRRRGGLSIQSTVLVMLLAVSVTSNVLVGVIGYVNATDSLRDAAFDRLIEVRDSRAREIERLFTTIESTVVVHSRGQSVVDATTAFSEAFTELESAPLDDAQSQSLLRYYDEVFGPALSEATGSSADAAGFVPTSTAARYLQVHYTAPHADFASAIAVDDAGDGSAWSAVHAQYHDYFRSMTELLEYEDVLLIDARGVVVYSAYKGVDLGTNVLTGPYRFSTLADAYGEALGSNLLGEVSLTDFEAYPPSLNLPAGWAATPIGRDGEIIGAMAVELPVERLSSVMTAGSDVEQGGLGDTGEAYLVGPDGLMRSPSRLLMTDPEAYTQAALAAGTSSEVVELAVARGTTLGLQPVSTPAAEAAQAGQSGTIIASSYLGRETLAAYGPVEVPGVDWVVVAEIDSAEAFAPVTEFTRNLVVSSAVLALVVSVLSLLLARIFVSPLRRLAHAAQRIAAGESGVTVDAGSNDELRAVSAAFNDMSRSLQVKADLLDEQRAESERLLRALMPEPVIQRYRDGDQTIAEDHVDVSVMYADIVGFEEFSRHRGSEATLETLNELVRQFDEAGGPYGVEHVRTTTKGYLASCGLTVPRIDNARRIVDYAIELTRIVDRFSAQWGVPLSLRAGLDLGEASSGLVGRAHMVYDLWGDAVTLAFRVQSERSESGIFLTDRVADALPGTVHLLEAGVIATAQGEERVWRIDIARMDGTRGGSGSAA